MSKAEKKVEHTPIPWRYEERIGRVLASPPDFKPTQSEPVFVIANTPYRSGSRPNQDANYAYIVKSANYHERLKEMVRQLKDYMGDKSQIRAEAERLLAEIGEEK